MNGKDPILGQWFSFDACNFTRTIAHGGAREISVARVLERPGGALRFIDMTVIEPGADIGLHAHELDNEELYIILSGKGWMTLDGRTFEVAPGHVVLNRPGGAHALKNIGEEALQILVIEVEANRPPVGETA